MTGPTDALNADERQVQPEFTGTAAEYFRIWIVNLFFTLATLGIYSAWAKVRKRRYFYGSTRLDGDSFELVKILVRSMAFTGTTPRLPKTLSEPSGVCRGSREI